MEDGTLYFLIRADDLENRAADCRDQRDHDGNDIALAVGKQFLHRRVKVLGLFHRHAQSPSGAAAARAARATAPDSGCFYSSFSILIAHANNSSSLSCDMAISL